MSVAQDQHKLSFSVLHDRIRVVLALRWLTRYHLGASGIFCGLNSGAVGGSRHSVCRPNTLLVESRPSIVTLTVAPSSYEARTPTMSQMLCLTPQCSASCRYSSGSTHLDASVHKTKHKVSLIARVNDTMVF